MKDRIQSYVGEKGLPVVNNELIDYILSRECEIIKWKKGRKIFRQHYDRRIMDNVPVSFWTKLVPGF